MDKKRVLVIAHFCAYGNEKSNNRFNYLAECMAEAGMDVEIVTSSFYHKDKVQRKVIEDMQTPYKTTLVYEPSYKRNVSLQRLLISHPTMARNLGKYLQKCEKPDVVYCAIPSVDVAVQAAQYAKEKKIPFVLDVLDLWPEAYKMVLPSFLYKLVNWVLKWRVNRVYAAADQIVAVSDTYVQRVKSVNEKCKTPIAVYLGTDAADFDANVAENNPSLLKQDGEFLIGYCGTLGHSYDLGTVIDAMKLLSNEGINNLHLVVMGSGPLEEKFKQKAAESGIKCTFTGKLPYGEMCAQLVRCDIAVNPIVADSAASIINKHADYALAGMPVVNTQASEEYRNLLATYKCGINCRPEDAKEVAEAIRTLVGDEELRLTMRNNARKMGLEKFDRAKTYGAILNKTLEIATTFER